MSELYKISAAGHNDLIGCMSDSESGRSVIDSNV